MANYNRGNALDALAKEVRDCVPVHRGVVRELHLDAYVPDCWCPVSCAILRPSAKRDTT
jgi:hypothetical protein